MFEGPPNPLHPWFPSVMSLVGVLFTIAHRLFRPPCVSDYPVRSRFGFDGEVFCGRCCRLRRARRLSITSFRRTGEGSLEGPRGIVGIVGSAGGAPDASRALHEGRLKGCHMKKYACPERERFDGGLAFACDGDASDIRAPTSMDVTSVCTSSTHPPPNHDCILKEASWRSLAATYN